MKEQKKDSRWYGFMASDKFVVTMNILRVLTFVGIAILIWVMASNIEEIKLMMDPCGICMRETDATCFAPLDFG